MCWKFPTTWIWKTLISSRPPSIKTSDLAYRPWGALVKLFDRQWWRRAWVMQEATTRNNTIFVCGPKVVSSEGMLMACVLAKEALRVLCYAFDLDESIPTLIISWPMRIHDLGEGRLESDRVRIRRACCPARPSILGSSRPACLYS
jgi:hypothetical protein